MSCQGDFEPSLQSHNRRSRGSDNTQRNWGMDGSVTADARAIAEAADAWLDRWVVSEHHSRLVGRALLDDT